MNEADGPAPSVVVPATGAPNSTAIMRSLGRRGIRPIAVSEQTRPPAAWSRHCHETAAAPSPTDELRAYRDALLSLAERDDVRTITPVREADVYVVARDRPRFAEHVGTPWPSMETLRSVHDRVALFAAARRAGVTVPDTRPVDEVDDWDRELIVKARFAILVREYLDSVPPDRCVTPPKTVFLEPDEGGPDVDELVETMGHVPIAQAYVDGTEYCYRGLYDHGEPVATSQKRLVRGYKYSRGPSVYHQAVDVPELEAAGRALLDELDWHGLASVGFIRDEQGTFNLLEVNPRFPASLPLDLAARADFPYYFWQLATGDGPIRPDYRPGVGTHLLRGELVHLHSVLFEDYPLASRPSVVRTMRDIATSCLGQPRFDLLSLDDPGPFVRDTLNAARGTLSGFRPGVTLPPTLRRR